MSLRESKVLGIAYSPARCLPQYFVRYAIPDALMQEKDDLPRMETRTLISHTLDAIVTAILFLFQIAKLEASMNTRLEKDLPASKV
jgi:hypothetical protein